MQDNKSTHCVIGVASVILVIATGIWQWIEFWDSKSLEITEINMRMKANIQSNINDAIPMDATVKSITDVPDAPKVFNHHLPKHRKRNYARNYKVGNRICKVLFPPSMQFLHHHKTGTALSRELRLIIVKYCKIEDNNGYWNQLSWLNFRDTPQSLIALQGNVSDNIKIHFWRDPVLTIISAFLYHWKSGEPWTSKPFSLDLFQSAATFFEHSTDPQRVYEMYREKYLSYDAHREPPIWRNTLNEAQIEALETWNAVLGPRGTTGSGGYFSIRTFYLYYLHDVINNIDLKDYGDFYGFDLHFNDSEIHRKYNIFRGNDSQKLQKWKRYPNMNKWYSRMFRSDDTLKYGLFYEMTRYLFGVFPEVYDFHFNLISDPENELKMEVWNSDFDRNINIILDRLNLIDSPGNRELLERYALFDVNISEERELLYQSFKTQDVSQLNEVMKETVQLPVMHKGLSREEQKARIREMRKKDHDLLQKLSIDTSHVHSRRNNTIFVDSLLGLDLQICLVFKHITNLIEYG